MYVRGGIMQNGVFYSHVHKRMYIPTVHVYVYVRTYNSYFCCKYAGTGLSFPAKFQKVLNLKLHYITTYFF